MYLFGSGNRANATIRRAISLLLWNCCEARPDAIQRRHGTIVNMASWNGKLGAPNFGAYSATKGAVISLTQALAREVAPYGIRVNAVCPGIVAQTPIRRRWSERGKPTACGPRRSGPR